MVHVFQRKDAPGNGKRFYNRSVRIRRYSASQTEYVCVILDPIDAERRIFASSGRVLAGVAALRYGCATGACARDIKDTHFPSFFLLHFSPITPILPSCCEFLHKHMPRMWIRIKVFCSCSALFRAAPARHIRPPALAGEPIKSSQANAGGECCLRALFGEISPQRHRERREGKIELCVFRPARLWRLPT